MERPTGKDRYRRSRVANYRQGMASIRESTTEASPDTEKRHRLGETRQGKNRTRGESTTPDECSPRPPRAHSCLRHSGIHPHLYKHPCILDLPTETRVNILELSIQLQIMNPNSTSRRTLMVTKSFSAISPSSSTKISTWYQVRRQCYVRDPNRGASAGVVHKMIHLFRMGSRSGNTSQSPFEYLSQRNFVVGHRDSLPACYRAEKAPQLTARNYIHHTHQSAPIKSPCIKTRPNAICHGSGSERLFCLARDSSRYPQSQQLDGNLSHIKHHAHNTNPRAPFNKVPHANPLIPLVSPRRDHETAHGQATITPHHACAP